MHGDRGSRVSASAQSFVRALMEVEPAKRLSAHTALAHPWLASSMPSTWEIDPSVLLSLWAFSDAPKLQRCYMSMMASCITNKEQAAVREQFMALDKQHRGAITLDIRSEDLCRVVGERFEGGRKFCAALEGRKFCTVLGNRQFWEALAPRLCAVAMRPSCGPNPPVLLPASLASVDTAVRANVQKGDSLL